MLILHHVWTECSLQVIFNALFFVDLMKADLFSELASKLKKHYCLVFISDSFLFCISMNPRLCPCVV